MKLDRRLWGPVALIGALIILVALSVHFARMPPTKAPECPEGSKPVDNYACFR